MMKLKMDKNKIILTVIDILIIIFSCFLSKILLLNTYDLGIKDWLLLERSIFLSIIIYQFFFRVFKLYRNITRYETGQDYLVYLIASVLSGIVLILIRRVFPNISILRVKELIISSFFIFVLSVSYRVAIREIIIKDIIPHKNVLKSKNNNESKKLLIIGGGNAARDIIKSLKNNFKNDYTVVGIIDDDPFKKNYSILGIKILGDRNDIEKVCDKYLVEEIFFAITNIDPKNKGEIFDICKRTNAKLRKLPSTEDIIKNKNLLKNMKNVEIEDLLGRAPIILDNNNIENIINENTILVTGGGGSIGSELCRQIVQYNPKRLIIFDIYENNLYSIQTELKFKYKNLNIEAIVGSIRDKKKLNSIFEKYKPDIVFHAAAHKHVPLMEDSPLEAIKNNILGTKNVIDCSDEFNVKKFILISTDKAVNPTNIMGATKRFCEMLVQAKNQVSNTEYAAVRFGNVLGSNGSVIPLFKKEIKEGGPVTVTHKEITRYFMTIPEAVGLVLQAMTYAKGGEIFVLDMGEPVKIYDLAVNLIRLSGYIPNVDMPIQITGLRPGEKLYEELLISEEGIKHTKHKKIFTAKLLEIAAEEIEEKVDILKEFVSTENHTIDEIKNLMKGIVPTYREPGDVNNLKINNQMIPKNKNNKLKKITRFRKDLIEIIKEKIAI